MNARPAHLFLALLLLLPASAVSAQQSAADRLRDLDGELGLREKLLSEFGVEAIAPGERLSELYEPLQQLYFRHQDALQSATELIAGVAVTDARRGEGRLSILPVHPDTQRLALDRVLLALTPSHLSLPPHLLLLVAASGSTPFVSDSASQFGSDPPREEAMRTEEAGGSMLDPIRWSRELSGRVVGSLLERDRMERLVLLRLVDPEQVSVHEVMALLVTVSWRMPVPQDPMSAAVLRVSRRAVLDRLLELGEDPSASPELRAAAAPRPAPRLRAGSGRRRNPCGEWNGRPALEPHRRRSCRGSPCRAGSARYPTLSRHALECRDHLSRIRPIMCLDPIHLVPRSGPPRGSPPAPLSPGAGFPGR